MILSFGNLECRVRRVGRNAGSALRMVIAVLSVIVEEEETEEEEGWESECEWEGLEGTSPWRFRIMSADSMAEKIG
jgi:hypothetical protein